ncbi:MAG: cation diffusion facilitator family transporter, partial [Planctomycetota bacterium]|nr:cation diffusion facilitator family transporter [Planctomycetota bacterium]
MPDFSLQPPPGADTAAPGNPPANPTPGPEVNQNHSWQVSQVTWAGCAVNLGLAILKGAGGMVAGSNALIADAVHTLTDLASDAIVLVGVRYWSQPADGEHPHGHGRIETIITLTIGIILAGVGVGLAFDSVAALAKGITTPTDGNLLPGPAVLVALLIALAAIFAKEILYRWTVAWGRRIRSSALVANAWHHRTDALSSIPPTLTLAAREIGIWD